MGGVGGGEGRRWSKFRYEAFFFFFFFFEAWSIREGHGKRRKGGNKSVATNMSVARLFIGARGRTGQACPSQDIVFEGWTRCYVVRY